MGLAGLAKVFRWEESGWILEMAMCFWRDEHQCSGLLHLYKQGMAGLIMPIIQKCMAYMHAIILGLDMPFKIFKNLVGSVLRAISTRLVLTKFVVRDQMLYCLSLVCLLESDAVCMLYILYRMVSHVLSKKFMVFSLQYTCFFNVSKNIHVFLGGLFNRYILFIYWFCSRRASFFSSSFLICFYQSINIQSSEESIQKS